MKLATTTGDLFWSGDTPDRIIENFRTTGFKYLDVSFYTDHRPGSRLVGDDYRRYIDEYAGAAAKYGVTYVQAHAPGYNPFDTAADHETGMLAMRRTIEACGILGIPNLVTHAGFSRDIPADGGRERYYAENREFYARLMDDAEHYGVNVLTENSAEGNMGSKYFFFTGADIREFIEYTDFDRLFACWDTGHANMRGVNQYDDIVALGDLLRAVHIQDNYGKYDEHIAPFMGTLNLDAVIQGLIAVGFGGPFTFEASNMIMPAGAWPHKRNEFVGPGGEAPRLFNASREICIQAESLLYSIGKYALEQYGLFED